MFLKNFYLFLRDNPAIDTDQIYPHVLPLNHDTDGITFELDNTSREIEYAGEVNALVSNVQIDIWSKDFIRCFDLAEQAETALSNFEGELVAGGEIIDLVRIDNEFSGFEPETDYYRVTYLTTISYSKP